MNTKQLRQKILDLAIRGKLVAQDPNDEPAAVLLERVRAEKERLIREGKIRRDKNDSKITTSDKSHYPDLPTGWTVATINELFIVNPRNNVDDNLEVSFVPMTLVDDGFSNRFTYQERKWGEVKSGFTHFADSDVGIAKITPCLENRKSAVFCNLKNGIGAGTTEIHIFRTMCPAAVLPEYLLWFFKSESFIESCIGAFSGAVGQQRVSKDHIANTLLPVPPFAEQRRIVSAIENAFAIISEIEANKSDLLSTVTAAKQKILSLAISGKLIPQNPNDEPAAVLLERIQAERATLANKGKVKKTTATPPVNTADSSHYAQLAKGWAFAPCGSVCEVYTGNSINEAEKKLKYAGQKIGLPYIGTKDVSNENEIDYENGVRIPDYSEFRIAPPQSALLCIEGGSAGRKIAITDKEVCFGNKLCCFATKGIDPHFIYFYLQSAEFKEVFKDSINGIIGGVSVNKLKELLLPVPPLAEQRRIVATVKAQFEILNKIATTLN